MDGSLIADVANAVASFANVAVTATLGVLVYKFTKRDEAGRIERALENDRDLRREEWLRERRARGAAPILDALVRLPGELLNMISSVSRSDASQFEIISIERCTETVQQMTGAIPALTNRDLRDDCIMLSAELNSLLQSSADYVLAGRVAMRSWTDQVAEQSRYLTGKANRLANELANWQDGEPAEKIDWLSHKPLPLPAPEYPSLGD